MDAAEREGRYPGKFGRIVLSALEEVVERNGLLAILRLARLEAWEALPDDFSLVIRFEEMGRLLRAMDELYGPTEGQAMAREAGYLAFRIGAQGLGFMLGLADLGRRLLPLPVRMRLGMETMAELFNRYSDHRVVLGEDDDFYYWSSERCGLCYGRRTTYPACGLTEGLLAAGLGWMRGGGIVDVREVSCIAQGERLCTFRIPKRQTVRKRDYA